MKKCFALIIKELTEIFRDRSTFIIFSIPALIFPLLNLGLDYMTSIKSGNINIYICSDNSFEINLFKDYVKNESQIHEFTGLKTEAYQKLSSGELSFIVCNDKAENKVKFICNPNFYNSISEATKIGESFSQYYSKTYQEKHKDYYTLQLNDIDGALFSVDESMIQLIAPIVFIMLICQTSANFSPDIFAGEKERKTFELLLMTAKSKKVILAGKTLALLVISFINLFVNFCSYALTKIIFEKQKENITTLNRSNLLYLCCSIILLLLISVVVSLFISLVSKKNKSAQALNEITVLLPTGFAVLIASGTIKLNSGFSKYCPIVNLISQFYQANLGVVEIKVFATTMIENLLLFIMILVFSYKYLCSEKSIVNS